MEEWRDVVGYEEFFMVSNLGRMYSKRTNKILNQATSKSGYKTIATRIGGRKGKVVCFKVHRLVAEAFIPSIDGKELVNHLDGDKANNTVDNLEWCNNSENLIHAFENGLYTPLKGEQVGSSKLTEKQVKEIREKGKSQGVVSLSREYKVSHQTIARVIRRENWGHVN